MPWASEAGTLSPSQAEPGFRFLLTQLKVRSLRFLGCASA
jgi:hypothetical protein